MSKITSVRLNDRELREVKLRGGLREVISEALESEHRTIQEMEQTMIREFRTLHKRIDGLEANQAVSIADERPEPEQGGQVEHAFICTTCEDLKPMKQRVKGNDGKDYCKACKIAVMGDEQRL